VSRPAVVPKHALGQHFLVDPNILRVIGRLAELGSDDVVLEIGPGLGMLTVYLADRVRRVHAVEIDRALEQHLRESIGARDNVHLVFGDAMGLDPGSLEPPPTKLVANLPYNVAALLVITTLEQARSLVAWCVMVQREVGDRFFATPGTASYGAVSVLVQLNARRTGWHAVSRTVFRPEPRVDSALVAFRRIAPPARYEAVKSVVSAAFAYRRKTLPNSLRLAGRCSREEAVAALAALGHDANTRAEALMPVEFVRLAERLS
jgi:16S rRNA (adenine1518-N6/adenine1519-N6)-dimethyltransferase